MMAVLVAGLLGAGAFVPPALAQDGKILVGRSIIRSPAFKPGPPDTVSTIEAPTSPKEWVLESVSTLDRVGTLITDELAAAIVADRPVSERLSGALGLSGDPTLQQESFRGGGIGGGPVRRSGGAFGAISRATGSIGPAITGAIPGTGK